MQPFELNLRHLRAIVAMRRLGSLTAAAEVVNLTQPALTQGLGRLERGLGVRLFERLPGGVAPTQEGAIVTDAADAAFAHLHRAARAISRNGARGFSNPVDLMTGPRLRALVAFADAGSQFGASRALGLSQPTLHRSLRDLADIVGVPLLDRRGRGLVLTDAGARLARGARLAMAELRLGLAEASGVDDVQIIQVGTMPLARARILPTALARLAMERPTARVRVVEGSWQALVEPLRDGVIDIMIGALRDVVPDDLEQRELLVDPVAVVGRAGHPLAGADPTIADLARHAWIVAAPGAPLRARWEELFAETGPPQAPVECGSVIVTRGLLAESDMLALLSPEQIAVELQAGLLRCVAGPLPRLSRRIGIVTRRPWRPGADVRALLEALHDAAGAVASGNVMADTSL